MTVILFLTPICARNALGLSARPLTSLLQASPTGAEEWAWTLTAIQGYLFSVFATSVSVFLPSSLRVTTLGAKPTLALRAAAISKLALRSSFHFLHGSTGGSAGAGAGAGARDALQSAPFTAAVRVAAFTVGHGGIEQEVLPSSTHSSLWAMAQAFLFASSLACCLAPTALVWVLLASSTLFLAARYEAEEKKTEQSPSVSEEKVCLPNSTTAFKAFSSSSEAFFSSSSVLLASVFSFSVSVTSLRHSFSDLPAACIDWRVAWASERSSSKEKRLSSGTLSVSWAET